MVNKIKDLERSDAYIFVRDCLDIHPVKESRLIERMRGEAGISKDKAIEYLDYFVENDKIVRRTEKIGGKKINIYYSGVL